MDMAGRIGQNQFQNFISVLVKATIWKMIYFIVTILQENKLVTVSPQVYLVFTVLQCSFPVSIE